MDYPRLGLFYRLTCDMSGTTSKLGRLELRWSGVPKEDIYHSQAESKFISFAVIESQIDKQIHLKIHAIRVEKIIECFSFVRLRCWPCFPE